MPRIPGFAVLILLMLAALVPQATIGATLTTADGPITVESWGYQLQGRAGRPLNVSELAAAPHDLLVIDYARDGTQPTAFTAAQVAAIQAGPTGRRVVAAYLSIGEASDFRSYWNPAWTRDGSANSPLTRRAPAWLGPVNPDWPEGRKVRYWHPGWQKLIYNNAATGLLDRIVAQGFDAAYLDIVDAYYFWAAEVSPADRRPGDPLSEAQAARRMVDFIVALADHARLVNPDFFVIPQNGELILDALGDDATRTAAFLQAVGAIAVEDVYHPGWRDVNNPFDRTDYRAKALRRDFLRACVPVFCVDYLNRAALIRQFRQAAIADGFIPYAAPTRELDRLGSP